MIGGRERQWGPVTAALALLLLSGVQPALADANGVWNATTSYPISVDDESCAAAGAYVYCVGGFTGDTYTADGSESTRAAFFADPSTSGGISVWTNTSAYPVKVNTQSCSISREDIYCVGGYAPSGATDMVYYAGISSAGISPWDNSTSYPDDVFGESCVTSQGYIYCIGGYDSVGLPTSSVYYASVSTTGVGTWTATTAYPTNVTGQSCVPSGRYVYCVGGIDDMSPPLTDAVYYALLSPDGISHWMATTSYPILVDIQSCVASGGRIYCIGGAPDFTATDAVYYSTIAPTGAAGAWTSGLAYPTAIGEQSCVAVEGFIYCVAGAPSAAEHLRTVYYAAASALAPVDTRSTRSATVNATTSRVTSLSASSSALSWDYIAVLAVGAAFISLIALAAPSLRGRAAIRVFLSTGPGRYTRGWTRSSASRRPSGERG